jgi:hypothetical protein
LFLLVVGILIAKVLGAAELGLLGIRLLRRFGLDYEAVATVALHIELAMVSNLFFVNGPIGYAHAIGL